MSRAAPRRLPRLVRRVVGPLFLILALAAVLLLGVFPTRAYLDKRGEIAEAQDRLAELEAANAAAQARVDALDTDAEIERLAREQYGLARPGEEVYRILPPPQEPVTIPDVWPFERLSQRLGE